MKKYPSNPGRVKAKETSDSVNVWLLSEKVDSLTKKLKAEESKFLALYEIRAAGMADFRKLYEQKVKLRKGFCIAMLLTLFQASAIFQLILNKTNWVATGALAGVLFCIALTILFETRVRKALSIDQGIPQFINVAFTIAAAAVTGYCIFILQQR